MSFAEVSDTRHAMLSSDFGIKLANNWFPGMADKLPTFKRGRNKGKPKGFITWRKVEHGGWYWGSILKPNTCVLKALHVGTNIRAAEHCGNAYKAGSVIARWTPETKSNESKLEELPEFGDYKYD